MKHKNGTEQVFDTRVFAGEQEEVNGACYLQNIYSSSAKYGKTKEQHLKKYFRPAFDAYLAWQLLLLLTKRIFSSLPSSFGQFTWFVNASSVNRSTSETVISSEASGGSHVESQAHTDAWFEQCKLLPCVSWHVSRNTVAIHEHDDEKEWLNTWREEIWLIELHHLEFQFHHKFN